MKITSKKEARICEQAKKTKNWKEIAKKVYEEKIKSGKKDGRLHITEPDKSHKLAGFTGINTAVTNNPLCALRRKNALDSARFGLDCICVNCYADNCCMRYSNLNDVLIYNQHILTSHLLEDNEIAFLPLKEYTRFEMFGDVSNTMQAKNYIKIARYYSDRKFAVWSKNCDIWAIAFKDLGKPENLVYVHSSSFLDLIDNPPTELESHVDYIFTVCSSKETLQAFLEQYQGSRRCAGVSCKDCLHCYQKGNNKYVFELKR